MANSLQAPGHLRPVRSAQYGRKGLNVRKQNPRKMSLFRETVRNLQDSQVEIAMGATGIACTNSDCASCRFDSCPQTCSYTSC